MRAGMTSSGLPSGAGGAVAHVFSVDVEDYFQVSAFERAVEPASWAAMPTRVERNTDILLEALDRAATRGTFFTLGWVADRYPAIVRRIAAAGHEVASHGWSHRRLTTLRPAELREELRRSKGVLEDLAGQEVIGFRAPSFSIVPGGEWAFDALLEEGYRYDSSLFPIRRPDYGYPAAPAEPHAIERPLGTLMEFPLATTVFLGARLPAAGGGYLRHLPYGVMRRAFREHGERGVPAMFYVHPWEVDPGQPRVPVGRLTSLRHYGGLARTLPRIERLLGEFRFTTAADALGLRPAALAVGAR